jgi:hypothetical protein
VLLRATAVPEAARSELAPRLDDDKDDDGASSAAIVATPGGGRRRCRRRCRRRRRRRDVRGAPPLEALGGAGIAVLRGR